MTDKHHLLGIDIGGTKCAVVLGTSDADIIDRITFPTEEPRGPEPVIEKLITSARSLLEAHRVPIHAIGISCGSPLDAERGIVQSPPNLPSWKDVPIVKILQDALGAPAFLENDANAGALAEFSFGAGRGCRNMVFITFGTGCGSGLILDGRLYRGTSGYAGEVGHLRLEKTGPIGYHKAGSFEGFCSGGGLAQLCTAMRAEYSGATILPPEATAADLGRAAEEGDELARRVLERCGEYLGRGLAYILDVLNPEKIAIGSIFVRCEKFLRPAMEKTLREEALPETLRACEIVPAGLGERVGDFAALSVARYAIERREY